MAKHKTILNLIGNTPIIDVSFLFPKSRISIFAKAEWMNPGGSLKDRPVKRMLSQAIESGELTKDNIIIDSSSIHLPKSKFTSLSNKSKSRV